MNNKHFPKWLLRTRFVLVYNPTTEKFTIRIGHSYGTGTSIAEAGKNAIGPVDKSRGDRGYKSLPGVPNLSKSKEQKRLGSLATAMKYKL